MIHRRTTGLHSYHRQLTIRQAARPLSVERLTDFHDGCHRTAAMSQASIDVAEDMSDDRELANTETKERVKALIDARWAEVRSDPGR